MRWFWIDRFTSFHSGREATAIKNVSLVEEALDDYCLGYPYLPPPLIIEGLAQLGGVLVAEHMNFQKRVVLAKVVRAVFHQLAAPGDQLHYHAVLESVQDEGAMVSCTSKLHEQPQAEIQLMFAFLNENRFGEMPLFKPEELTTMLRLMRFFEVAVDPAGRPLEVTTDRSSG